MIEYEVTVSVDAALDAEYLAWLREHVAAMLDLPGFLGADIARVLEPADAGRVAWCVRYRLRDAEALATYLEQHAPAMRAQGERRFGDRMRASRRVLQALPRQPGPVLRPGP